MLASHENIGGFPKCWRLKKTLADLQNVPAACTGPTCQNIPGSQKYWRLRIFSPIPVKTPKSYLGS
jgi:hypothetical protein